MFCKKCGMKIERGASKCSHCGEPAATAEYCGGFWGITRIEQGNTEKQRNNLATEDLSKYRDAVLAAQETEEKMTRQYSEEIRALKAERRRLEVSCLQRTLLAVVLGLLVIILFVLVIKGTFRIKKLEKEVDGLPQQVEETAEEQVGDDSGESEPALTEHDDTGGPNDDQDNSGQNPSDTDKTKPTGSSESRQRSSSDSQQTQGREAGIENLTKSSVNKQTGGEIQTEQTSQDAGETENINTVSQGGASADSGADEAEGTDPDSGAPGAEEKLQGEQRD